MCEWTIIVRISRVVSPFWFVLNGGVHLNIKTIVHVYVVWRSLSVIEMGEWSVVV